jgi:hypothetical protein
MANNWHSKPITLEFEYSPHFINALIQFSICINAANLSHNVTDAISYLSETIALILFVSQFFLAPALALAL